MIKKTKVKASELCIIIDDESFKIHFYSTSSIYDVYNLSINKFLMLMDEDN